MAKFAFTLVLIMAFGRPLLSTVLGEDSGFSSNRHQQNYNEIWSFLQHAWKRVHGIFLNYHMCRMFERLMGSRKFGSFLFFSYLLCRVLESVLLKLVDGDATMMMEKPAAFYITLPLAVVYFVVGTINVSLYPFRDLELRKYAVRVLGHDAPRHE